MYTFYNVYCYLQLLFSMVRCVLVINMYCLDVKTDIIKMLQCLIDNIFTMFGGRVYQQIIGIPFNTNGAPPLTDVDFISMMQTSCRAT